MLKKCPCYDGMEENGTIGDFSRSKLTKVPEAVLNRGRHLEELYLDSNNIELLPKVCILTTFVRMRDDFKVSIINIHVYSIRLSTKYNQNYSNSLICLILAGGISTFEVANSLSE